MEFLHVPGASMKMEDTFSKGLYINTSHPNEAEDAEEFLDQWESGANIKFLLNYAFEHFHSCYDIQALPSLPAKLPTLPKPPTYSTSSHTVSNPSTKDDAYSLLGQQLSKSLNTDKIHSNKFFIWKLLISTTHKYLLSKKVIQVEVMTYTFYTVLIENAISQEGQQKEEKEQIWEEICTYLTGGIIPDHYKTDKDRLYFVQKTNQFVIIDGKLYIMLKKKSINRPRLVIEDSQTMSDINI
jgi:hypothetical protein